MPRWLKIFLTTSTILVVISTVPGATAVWGAETHLFEASFGPDGTASSSFGQPAALAVDQSTGTLYVADFASQTVQKFDSAHEPEAFTGVSPSIVGGKLTGFLFNTGEPVNQLAVDSTSHDFYVLAFNHPVKAYQSDGEPANFTAGPGVGTNEIGGSELCGVAVDVHGDIYVSEASDVQIYAPTGEPLATIPAFATCNLAVDSQGTAYLTVFNGAVERYTPSEFPVTASTTYTPGGAVDANTSRGVTVDPSTDHLYVDEGTQVAEYDKAGTRLGSFGAAEPGALTASEGVAVNGTSGAIYVSDAKGKQQVEIFGPTVLLPDVTTGEATNLTAAPGQATLNGSVNPDGVPVSACEFEYGTTTAYGATTACSSPPGAGTEPVLVSANLTGLTPAVVYHYRLIASNTNGQNDGLDQSFIAPGVVVDSESVSEVTATSATLNAQVNPNKSSTSYRFEYGLTASYGHSAPIPDGQAGSGSGDVAVNIHIQDLTPGITYHYRVVASGLDTTTGPDQTFFTQTTGSEPELPDNRQWELVSPPDKHGALIEPLKETGVIQASASGDAITYLATAATEDQPQGNAVESQLLSTRGPSGWGTRDIAVPHDSASGAPTGIQQYKFFSRDLSLSVVQPAGPFSASVSPEASEGTAYLRTDFSSGGEVCPTAAERAAVVSCYRPLVTGKPGFANVPEGNVFTNEAEGGNAVPVFAGATPDLNHVLIESGYSLMAPGKTKVPHPEAVDLYEWTAGKLTFLGEDAQRGVRSVSDDGSRVVFSGLEARLLLRDVSLGQTLRLDVPEPDCLLKATCGEGATNPEFQGATGDGSKIFFTDTRRLTADAGAAETPDLYECDLVVEAGVLRCELHDLTPPGATKEAAKVLGHVLGVSSDGSWVYFVANGGLATGAVSGADNLYVRHGGVTRLVGVLSSDDGSDWGPLAQHPAGVSGSGEWLVFMSDVSLTGYDNRDVVSGRLDEEVFLYHASTGVLVCASCNPTGARPAGVEYKQIEAGGLQAGLAGGNKVWREGQWVAANVPAWTPYEQGHAVYQSRYLSGSGRLFFNSGDALVPRDVNRTEDVYEFEPSGVGGCTSASVSFGARSGGCVRLISSGTSPEESGFVDASESGGDVFFLSSARLSGLDVDTSVDVYDAHECTGVSPCLPMVARSLPCDSGDACKPAPSPQPPVFGASGSATFSGLGNIGPQSVVAKAKSLTRAQRLARALKACRRNTARKRAVCERRARRQYGKHVGSSVKRGKG